MFILGRTQMISGATSAEAVKRLMAKGFDGVELSAYDKEFQPRMEFFDADFPGMIKDTLIECGAKAYSVSAHMDFVAFDEKFEIVQNVINVAGKINAPIVIITGAQDGMSPERDALYAKQIERTSVLCGLAKERGITLAVEFEPGFVVGTTLQVLQLIKNVGSDALKINMDIGHSFLVDPDPMAAIASCSGLIAHAHIENMEAGIHNHIIPSEGDMDIKAYFRQLRAAGYDGYASIDLYQYDYESIAESSIKFIRDAWNSM